MTKCSNCQKETTKKGDVDFCTNCTSLKNDKQKKEEKSAKIEILEEINPPEEEKPATNGNGENGIVDEKEHKEEKEKEEDADAESAQEQRFSPDNDKTLAQIKAEEVASKKAAHARNPAPPLPPPPPTAAVPPSASASPELVSRPAKQTKQRGGKITRNRLNGVRSPIIMKRLRKSTRSTRFKSKLTGRGNAAGNTALNGHQVGQSNNASSSSAAGHSTGASASNQGGGGGKAQSKAGAGGAGGGAGARNRRALFKRVAQKTPRTQACTRFVKSVFFKGSYMQIGDIVSIVDSEQRLYYAQIRGLLIDAYCEKSAFLTWLIPTQDSPDPKDGFDPATYLIGPDEELSRKLCFLEFVMHAPSNYYYDRTTPFPLPDVDEYTANRDGGYIWTRLPTIKRERERERERKAAS